MATLSSPVSLSSTPLSGLTFPAPPPLPAVSSAGTVYEDSCSGSGLASTDAHDGEDDVGNGTGSSQNQLSPLPATQRALAAPPVPPPRTAYQQSRPFADRLRLSEKLRSKYPGCVPVVFEPADHVTFPGDGGGGGAARASTAAAAAAAATPPANLSSSSLSSQQQQQRHGGCGGGGAGGGSAALCFALQGGKTLGHAVVTLRRRLAIGEYQSLFLSVSVGVGGNSSANNKSNDGGCVCGGPANGDLVLAPSGAQLGELHARYADPDGMLYVAYSVENTFGGGRTTNERIMRC